MVEDDGTAAMVLVGVFGVFTVGMPVLLTAVFIIGMAFGL